MGSPSLEQQLLARIRALDDNQLRRILDFVDHELAAGQGDLDDWLKKATAFRQALVEKYGSAATIDIQTTLDEIREEASWPRS